MKKCSDMLQLLYYTSNKLIDKSILLHNTLILLYDTYLELYDTYLELHDTYPELHDTSPDFVKVKLFSIL